MDHILFLWTGMCQVWHSLGDFYSWIKWCKNLICTCFIQQWLLLWSNSHLGTLLRSLQQDFPNKQHWRMWPSHSRFLGRQTIFSQETNSQRMLLILLLGHIVCMLHKLSSSTKKKKDFNSIQGVGNRNAWSPPHHTEIKMENREKILLAAGDPKNKYPYHVGPLFIRICHVAFSQRTEMSWTEWNGVMTIALKMSYDSLI